MEHRNLMPGDTRHQPVPTVCGVCLAPRCLLCRRPIDKVASVNTPAPARDFAEGRAPFYWRHAMRNACRPQDAR